MALLETREGFQDTRLLTCPGTEGDIRTGENLPNNLIADFEDRRVTFAVAKVMLQFGAPEVARQLANIASGEKPFSNLQGTMLAIGQEVVIPQ